MHIVLQVLGLTNGNSRWYLFWSGIEADMTQLALVGALIGYIRIHTCCLKFCVRRGRHSTNDGFGVCSKHYHPEMADGIAEVHRLDRYAKRVLERKQTAQTSDTVEAA